MKLKDLKERLSGMEFKVKSVKKLYAGTSRTTYLINTDKGKYVLKLYEKRKKSNIQKLINLLIKINSKKEITINPINSKILLFNDYVGFIYRFFEGKHFTQLKIRNKLFEFGKVVGDFNKLTKNISLKMSPRERNMINNYVEHMLYEAKKTMNFLNKKHDSYSLKIAKLMEKGIPIVKKEYNGSKYRIQLIHGDLHFDNIIYDTKSKKYLIIDMDGLRNAFLVQEISVMLSYLLTNSPNENKRRIKGILGGYESKVKLKVKEKKALPFLMILRKFSQIVWLISQFNKKKITKREFRLFMNGSLKQLKIIINQYEQLKKELK